MKRAEGKHHCLEILGWIQLARIQRTKRQGRIILVQKDFLASQTKTMDSMVAENQFLDFSRSMIESTHPKSLT
jgi:hypothetical protein